MVNMSDEFDLNDIVDPSAGKKEPEQEGTEYDYDDDEQEYTSVREQVKKANDDLSRSKRTSQAAAPRRNFQFDAKLVGRPRVVRDPNPGFNSDPEYTEASQAFHHFENTTMAEYEIQKAGYDHLLAEHKAGRGEHPGLPPVMPEAPVEAKVIRAPSEANRWKKARDRAKDIAKAREGIARQYSGKKGSSTAPEYRQVKGYRGTEGGLLSTRTAEDDELIAARKAAAERAKRPI